MPKKLKILMIAPTPYFSDRGCHVRIYEEARALKACGHEVVIVTYHIGRDIGDVPVVRIPNIPWYRKLSAGPSWHKPYLDILLLYKVMVVAKRFKPDIIHAHLHEGAFLAVIAKGSLKAPLVFDCQGSLCGELLDHGFMHRNGLLHCFFAKLEAWISCRAHHIVTSSTPTAELLRRNFPEISERLTSLTDAVDTDFFRPFSRDEELLRTFGVPSDKKLIVYLGAMTEYQGVGLLLEALSILSKERDDFHALLMGYPEEGYVERARYLGLADKITLTGKLDYAQAPRCLSLGDVAVSPKISTTEANGKLLNYMSCGLPCVVFDNQVNRELLGDYGIYVQQQDAQSLSDSLLWTLETPERLEELSVLVRDYAVRNHSWSARVEVLTGIYSRLLQPSEN